MKKLTTALLFTAIAYFSFIGVALAQGAVMPNDGSLLDLLRPVYEAIVGGQWWIAAMSGIILATTAAKRYLPGKLGAWVNGEYGQPLTVLILSFAGAGLTALIAAGPGAVMSLSLAWLALKVAVVSAGGYTMLKQLIAPLIQKLADVSPSGLKPIFSILLWAFSKRDAIQTAETVGGAAVAANPAAGVGNSAGPTTSL
jgi:hypothetical protein